MSTNRKQTKMFQVQIANQIIRNKNINDKEFVLYAKLVQLYQKSNSKDTFNINFRLLKDHLHINDNRTFKKLWDNLFTQKLILNNINRLSNKSNSLEVKLNIDYIPSKENRLKFTQLPYLILDKFTIQYIGHTGVRIMYYLESYIDRRKKFDYELVAYPSEETIALHTGNSRATISKYIKKLRKERLIKIEEHKLQPEGYDENDKLLYVKYNNKYFLRLENIEKRHEKWMLETLDI